MTTFALFSWPIISLILFASLGRERGLIWTVVAGYLLLPEGIKFDLPGLPSYNKNLAVAVGACLGALIFWGKLSWPNVPRQVEDGKGFKYLLYGLLALSLFGVIMTVQDNGAPIINDGTRFFKVRQGLTSRDIIGMMTDIVTPMLPFLLAWRLLRAPEHHREVLMAVVIMGCIWAVFAMIEMRLSPRFNATVYGFFPHEWRQHIRGGQFRPVVFLRHGLWLAFFLLSAAFCAYALMRDAKDGGNKMMFLGAALFITAVLVISPNLGALLLLVLFLPLLYVPRWFQIRVVTVVALIFLTFPAVRQAGLVPLDGFLNFASSISHERAESLRFRINNEDALLDRLSQKPVFGWGGWGRYRVVDERGIRTTVSDGLWIITLGERGWVGYVGFFGVLVLPLLMLARRARHRTPPFAIMGLSLITAANLVYLVPNSALSPIGWLMAGTIAGFVAWKPSPSTRAEATEDEKGKRARISSSPYTRFPREFDKDGALSSR